MLDSFQVGDRIADRYEVIEVLQGGMALVYLARDRSRSGDRFVALKTLRAAFLDDRNRTERFAAECHLWVHLGSHPNIVQAFAVEEIEGRPHIVLELVSGGELQRRIGTPHLDPPRALRLGIEFCLGMEHAMRNGLRCHRDIKPANLLMTADGTLKITDFGLAGIRDEFLATDLEPDETPIALAEGSAPQRIIWADPRDQPSAPRQAAISALPAAESALEPTPHTSGPESRLEQRSSPPTRRLVRGGPVPESTIDYTPPARIGPGDTAFARLTRTGVLLGTLPYMAPEQFRDASAVDVRADIYSFGVVLFQMLTAELPFKGDTAAKLDNEHSHYDPPSVIPSIPRRFAREAERIDGIVRRCLAKDPANRFEAIPALRRALNGVLRHVSS